MKTISIITPTLNSVKTIERNLSSVSNQSTKDLEQIIIDGYSDDGTRSLIKSYEGHDIIFLDENEGIYQAINQGIKKARGKYIMLLNSDDWLPDDAINTVIKKLNLIKKILYFYFMFMRTQKRLHVLNRLKNLIHQFKNAFLMEQ